MIKDSKKKILVVTNIPAPYRVDFFEYLQNHFNKYEFYIIFTSANEDNRKWENKSNILKNVVILKSLIIKVKQKLYIKYIHIPKGLIKNINIINPDVVIAFEYNLSAIYSLLWAKIFRKKFIHLTDGTLNSETGINFLQKILRKIIIKNSDAYIASSTKAKEKLLYYGADENRTFISLLTEDLTLFVNRRKSFSDNTCRLLYVGQIIERKGVELLLDALALIKCNYELRIVGNGDRDYINNLINYSKSINIYEKIEFIDYKSGKELVHEYDNSDIFIFPTKNDCFGLVMLEALAMNRYQIVSKYADGAYDIINDSNGVIINPYDKKKFAFEINDAINLKKNVIVSNIEKFKIENTSAEFINAIKKVL